MYLQVSKFYAPFIGGVETVVKDYVNSLKDYGEVIVLCIDHKIKLKTRVEIIDGIKVYRCSSLGTFFSMPLSLSFFFYLFMLGKRAKVIHFHEPFPLATFAGLFVNKNKIAVTWHSDIIRQKLFKPVTNIMHNILCKKAKLIITTSNELKSNSFILKKFQNKTEVVPLWLDSNKYKTIDYSKVSSDITCVGNKYYLYLGRLSYYKGLLVLVETIRKLENIKFVIVGQGELAQELEKRLHRTKNVIFINKFVNEEEKKYLLKNCKCLLFPSIFPSEAFGLIQLEAMLYSKPVINTNLPTGVPWVSKHLESGITVKAGDIDDLVKAIELIDRDKDLYFRVSEGARERCYKLFLKEQNSKKLIELYKKYFGT